MSTQSIKQRFGIIGNSSALNFAISIAERVAPTNLSVLISGESGTGKEVFSQIIHQLSARKHNKFIAVNCGAIPEGTIDSELFGHEKGSFTGANDKRKGYFETVDGGTIFLDEIGEMPIGTQSRLLRVLETGEFIKVGSSKIHKTDVRVVGATNVNMKEAIQKNKFREDLYYRLNTIEIKIPALRDRHDDIYLLFRKFAADFADKYHTPAIRLTLEAQKLITSYRWPGNIRQLRNLVEQISVIETDREIGPESIRHYIPDVGASELPMLINKDQSSDDSSFGSEREIMYKLLFDMRSDMNNLKKLVTSLLDGGSEKGMKDVNPQILKQLSDQISEPPYNEGQKESYVPEIVGSVGHDDDYINTATIEDENLSLQDKEIEMIKKALERNRGKRKGAAEELGISERTLYRKIKQFKLY